MIYDLSEYQANLHLTDLPNVEGVILRLSIAGRLDKCVNRFVKEAEENNTPYGFYIYIKSCEPDEMYNEFLKSCGFLKNHKNSLPVFIDIEEVNHNNLLKSVITDFYLKCKKHLSLLGYVCGLYSTVSYMLNLFDYEAIKNEIIWLPHWTNTPNEKSRYINKFKCCVLWQYGCETVNGEKVDANIPIFEDIEIKPLTEKHVKVNTDARYWYDGVPIPKWVYSHVFEIFELVNDRAVIGITSATDEKLVTGAINVKDLIIL